MSLKLEVGMGSRCGFLKTASTISVPRGGGGGSSTAVVAAALLGVTAVAVGTAWWCLRSGDNSPQEDDGSSEEQSGQPSYGYLSMIGKTPMLELKVISKLLQCKILVKLECNNPGGTGKDRAAKYMIRKAMRDPRFCRGCDVVEGTSGSTGIALASLCRAQGLNLHVVMPDDQATEKRLLLESLGAKVKVVPNCAISNRDHYVNSARRLAEELGGIFFDQFENLANFEAHYKETGPEIWTQTNGGIDAFVMSAGTGGTIAGVSQYLKERKGNMVRVVLADPQGSSLLRKVTHGVCFTQEQSERRIKKHRYDSIIEGVGLDRITANFDRAKIDSATMVTDQEVVLMAHWLLQNEGLFVGSSTALNIAAACITARELGPGHTIVTIVCDQGQRHASRFWNKDYLANYNLVWPEPGSIPACLMLTTTLESSPTLPIAVANAKAMSPPAKLAGLGGGASQPSEEDDELGQEYAHFEVKDDLEGVIAPNLSVPPPQALAPPPTPPPAHTPKKPLIRPAAIKGTPAATGPAAATPSITVAAAGFDDLAEETTSSSSSAAEAARVQDLKLKMQAKKEQQRLKRAMTPQKAATTLTE